MIFIDSSVFIASVRTSEAKHSRAVELIRSALESGETVVTTDHIIDETLTYLKKKEGKQVAYLAGRNIFSESKLQIEYASPSRNLSSLELLGKIEGLSFCDALTIIVSKELAITKICSFDADFDKIRGLHRIE